MSGSPDRAVLRIIDANANRVREGLRVVEEYARFQCEDAELTATLKDLRHEVARLLGPPDIADALVAARDVAGDVGAESATPSEQTRPDAAAVVRANLKRVQEGLRALEEYGKVLSPNLGTGFKRLRFAAYDAEQRVAALLARGTAP